MTTEIFSAIIGGGLALAGGLLVFIFTVVYTEIREARQRMRARLGYARLLDAEIEANGRALEKVYQHTDRPWEDLVVVWLERPPTDEVWKKVREPLAPLVAEEDLKTLDEHYRLLSTLLDLKDNPEAPELGVWGVTSDLEDEVPKLRDMLRVYATPTRRVRWLGF